MFSSRFVVAVFLLALSSVGTSLAAQLQLEGEAKHRPAPEVQPLIPSPVAKLLPDPGDLQQFGISVAMSPGRIVVGSPLDDDGGVDAGAAYVYELIGCSWVRQQKLWAPDAAAGDWFGLVVAMEDDVIVVGAGGREEQGQLTGAAYVFEWTGAEWVVAVKLLPPAPIPHPGDHGFGNGVAISHDVIVVGSPDATTCGTNAVCGAAYVYIRSGSSWRDEPNPVVPTTTLAPTVSVQSSHFGDQVAIDGDIIVASAPNVAGGAVYVFEKPAGGWGVNLVTTESAKLVSATSADPGAAFGIRLDVQWDDIEGDLIAIGAWSDDDYDGTNSGAGYIIREPPGGWAGTISPIPVTPVEASHLIDAGDFFGMGVSIDGDRVTIGAPYGPPPVIGGGVNSGSLFVFEYDGAGWAETQQFYVLDAESGVTYSPSFGYAAALSRSVLVVGALDDDNVAGVDAGAVYVFNISP